MSNPRLKFLFDRYLEDNCSLPEKRELSVLVLTSSEEAQLRDLLEEFWDQVNDKMKMPKEKADAMVADILHTVKENAFDQAPAKLRKLTRIYWQKIAVAASILLVLGFCNYYIFFHKKSLRESPSIAIAVDIKAPEKSKAIITLADGKKISVDSLSSLEQGNVRLTKTADGKIVYAGSEPETQITKNNTVLYNTLSNPRGSKVIDMTLSDGSHVWLNSGSSITYAVAFMGNERKVSVTGEAYFEVAHNASKPFNVTKGEIQIAVLGTHFNVNTYDDEQDMKVTLLEGSVKVSLLSPSGVPDQREGKQWSSLGVTLKPGQQARVSNSIKIADNIDENEVLAWKNGRFLFTGTDLRTIMRQVMRWYDVDVVYDGHVQERFFTADISRNTNLSELLKVLELSKIHFKIDGKKLIVMP